MYGTAPSLDPGDPLYDPCDDDNYILVSEDASAQNGTARSPPRHNYDPEHRRMVLGPMFTLKEFKRRVVEILIEFFSSEDVDETISAIKELGCPEYHYEVVKRSISLAMDRKERERELVSKFLSASHPGLMTTDQLGKGFERLFEFIDDLEIDTPGATEIAAAFLSRAVVDEIIPPAFLVDPVVVGIGGDVVAQTKRILCRDHQYSRVERIWGPGDGRPVSELKVAIDQLLNEFLLSRQLTEAEHCVRELGVPHFHHELVKRAVIVVMDKGEEDQVAISDFLAHLVQSGTLSTAQLEQGFGKLSAKMDDLVLDSPKAPVIIAEFVARAKTQNLLPDASSTGNGGIGAALNGSAGGSVKESAGADVSATETPKVNGNGTAPVANNGGDAGSTAPSTTD